MDSSAPIQRPQTAEPLAAVDRYRKDGFWAPVDLIDSKAAASHRRQMEFAESKLGPLHYVEKIHTLLRSPYQLATMPHLLDLVEALIGPDILIHNVTFVVKEAHTDAFASWHQDFAYRDFESDDQVSVWIALSPATPESGCMRMIPGSHLGGRVDHELGERGNNLLARGQAAVDVDESSARWCTLTPGQASFHHGWTLHASGPNVTDDRRIGLKVQYFAPHMRDTVMPVSAIVARGEDRYGHFRPDQLRWEQPRT